jgi:SWI/SNF-related matrix-associated actin-dependent regulator of chromatin subfamily A3
MNSTQAQRDDDSEILQPFLVVNNKCVGVRYYNGIVTTGEQLLLRREPNNPYDRNAIRIDNVRGEQVGHVPAFLAAKFAPLIDRRKLWLEGIVAGPKATFDMPVRYELLVPGREPERSEAMGLIKTAKIPGAVLAEEFKRLEKVKEAERLQKERLAAIAKAKTAGRGGPVGPGGRGIQAPVPESEWMGSSQTQIQENWNQLVDTSTAVIDRRAVEGLVHQFGVGEADLQKMAKASQPERLRTQMLPYQLQGLAWMLKQEHPQTPTTKGQVVQLWKLASPGRFTNIATLRTMNSAPDFASGGILADDMGLGKTLQIISLIVADVAIEKSLVPIPKVDENTCTAGTLIVAPVSVMSNWSGQIEQHVSPDRPLKIFRYHGSNRFNAELSAYDVVITSYGTLAHDFANKNKTSKGLFSAKWRRIVLDEAHTIRNPKSKASLAAAGLEAGSRWALSGTPIVNNLKDLYSLIRFLRYSGGLSDFDIFNRTLIRPLNRGDTAASQLLQILMATVCLRRLKEMKFVDLRLPGISEFVHKIQFWPEEREKYELLEQEAKGMLVKFQSQQTDYRFILEILLRMRQTCNHSSLCAGRIESLMKLSKMDKVDLSDENIGALQDLLQLAIEAYEECSVCLEPLHNPRITICKHVFGLECIEKVIDMQHKCPMCRCELPALNNSVVEPRSLEDPNAITSTPTAIPVQPANSSSKIEALLKILKAAREKEPGTKTVLFSQWTSFLNLLEPFLKANNIGFARIDGSMNPPKRDYNIVQFGTDEKCEVLLASLAVASVGLNLVMANQVMLVDSWWAPAVEDQAIDRVYRLGQTKPVTVWRLVMEGGIEERVLKIQEKKRTMVSEAFREGAGRKRKVKTTAERIREVGELLGANIDANVDANNVVGTSANNAVYVG